MKEVIHPTKADIGSKMLDTETLEDESEDAAITSRVAEYWSGSGQNRWFDSPCIDCLG